MKRFRRKSEALSRGKDGRDRDPSSGAEEQTEQQAPPPLLPSLQRQSLILVRLNRQVGAVEAAADYSCTASPHEEVLPAQRTRWQARRLGGIERRSQVRLLEMADRRHLTAS